MYIVVAIILFVLGLIMNIYVGRNRFYRRGPGGLQHFSSYGRAVVQSGVERIIKFLGIVFMILGIAVYFGNRPANHKVPSQNVYQK